MDAHTARGKEKVSSTWGNRTSSERRPVAYDSPKGWEGICGRVFQIPTCCLLLGVTGNASLESSATPRNFLWSKDSVVTRRNVFLLTFLPSFLPSVLPPTFLFCLSSLFSFPSIYNTHIPLVFLSNKIVTCTSSLVCISRSKSINFDLRKKLHYLSDLLFIFYIFFWLIFIQLCEISVSLI